MKSCFKLCLIITLLLIISGCHKKTIKEIRIVDQDGIYLKNNDSQLEYDYKVILAKNTTSFTIKCETYPKNSDCTKLDFYSIQELENKIMLVNNNDGSCTVNFNIACSPTIVITSTDNQEPISIKIKLEMKISGSDIF